MPRTKETRNPFGSIFKREVSRKIERGGKPVVIKQTVYDARKRYKDLEGNPKEKFQRCRTSAEAQTALTNFQKDIELELAAERQKPVAAPDHTFFELVDYFRDTYVVPAIYSGRQKIVGYEQDLKVINFYLEDYKAFFGDRRLQEFTYEDLHRYYTFISQRITKKGIPPTVATINHYLKFLRRIFNVGMQLDWVTVNPFRRGAALIRNGAENRRSRMLTFDEERRLLAECVDETRPVKYRRKDKLTKEEKEVESTVEICRAYLRSIIICALDTAMRKGEIQSLQWKEVFLTEKYIFIDGEKTKTGVDGLAPVTPRLADELEKLKSQFPHEPEDHVFPFGDFKKAFDNAAADAGIENLQFRDLRSTASTRMLLAGNTGELVRKITRHTQVKTFHDHYTNIDIQNARLIGEKLADFTSGQISKGNDKENMKKAASGEAA